MEFAIHECLPIYSGGLGVLAGRVDGPVRGANAGDPAGLALERVDAETRAQVDAVAAGDERFDVELEPHELVAVPHLGDECAEFFQLTGVDSRAVGMFCFGHETLPRRGTRWSVSRYRFRARAYV